MKGYFFDLFCIYVKKGHPEDEVFDAISYAIRNDLDIEKHLFKTFDEKQLTFN